MDYEFWAVAVAGLLGGIVMSALIAMMRNAGKTEMDLEVIEGAMVTGDASKARAVGMVMHLAISALLIAPIYAALFQLFDVAEGNAWWVGALFGVVHGVLAGLFMAALPAMHPRMADDGVAPGRAHGAAALLLKPPGVFAKNYGAMTPAGVIMVHVAYGLVLGLVYAWLV